MRGGTCRKISGLRNGGQQQQKQGVLKGKADATEVFSAALERAAWRRTVKRMLPFLLLISATSTFRMNFGTQQTLLSN
jgi:hypothetical protein